MVRGTDFSAAPITGSGGLAPDRSRHVDPHGLEHLRRGHDAQRRHAQPGRAGAISAASTIVFNGGTLQFTASNTSDYSNQTSSAPPPTRRTAAYQRPERDLGRQSHQQRRLADQDRQRHVDPRRQQHSTAAGDDQRGRSSIRRTRSRRRWRAGNFNGGTLPGSGLGQPRHPQRSSFELPRQWHNRCQQSAASRSSSSSVL